MSNMSQLSIEEEAFLTLYEEEKLWLDEHIEETEEELTEEELAWWEDSSRGEQSINGEEEVDIPSDLLRDD